MPAHAEAEEEAAARPFSSRLRVLREYVDASVTEATRPNVDFDYGLQIVWLDDQRALEARDGAIEGDAGCRRTSHDAVVHCSPLSRGSR